LNSPRAESLDGVVLKMLEQMVAMGETAEKLKIVLGFTSEI
jgi:hypothetical protein